jgi:CheY-like chemotaxis protein
MALHELATNAAKHGALSNESGRVTVSWRVQSETEGDPLFTMSWIESDGPPVEQPSRRGFGSTVIDGMVRMSLGCNASIEFAPTGLVWRIDCPAEKVIEGRSVRPATRPNGAVVADRAASADLRRVLVVEDEALIAMEIADALSNAGWEVVGPASSVAQALALLASTGCDAAVLDVNLGNETVEPVARELITSGTPFVAVSGYSRDQQSSLLRNAPLIGKPLKPELLVAEIRRCFG